MPRSRLFFMSTIVGLPGAGGDGDVVEAELQASSMRERAAEAHAVEQAELLAPHQDERR